MPEKILVVAGQGKVCRRLSEILTSEGYVVFPADNMADGLRLCQKEALDLVIADIRVPIDDCLHKLRENHKSELTVELIVTGVGKDRDAAAHWLGRGVYDFLPDPVMAPHFLIAAVERALQKRRLVLENMRLAIELDQIAIMDPLTGVYNRRHMFDRLMDEIVRDSRYNRTFLLVAVDIDGFRRVNETYGRDAGDLVLTQMARLLEASLRSADSVFRSDGGKFVILLPETGVHQGIRVAERILEGVRYHVFDCGENNLRVTVSIGAAEFPLEARDVSSLIELADKRLQGAKKSGGDGFRFEDRRNLVPECGI